MRNIVVLITEYVSFFAQILAIIVIVIGMVKALWVFFKDALFKTSSKDAISESRLELGHAFSLGLGFLIGSSILKSVVAPTWDDIGKLAAIIVIRTVLNFFLLREITTFTKKPKSQEKVLPSKKPA